MMQNEIILQLISDDIKQIDQLIETMKTQKRIDSTLLQFAQLKTKSFAKSLEILENDDTLHTSYEIKETVAPKLEHEPKSKLAKVEVESSFIPEVLVVKEEESKIVEEVVSELILEEETDSVSADLPIFEMEDDFVAEEEPVVEQEEFSFTESEITIELDNDEVLESKELESSLVEEDEETGDRTSVEEFVATKEKVLLGEQVKSQSKSLNDLFGNHNSEESYHRKVESLSRSIGINDKFLFIRELFSDGNEFQESIEALDRCLNREEAIEYMSSNFKWTKNDASDKFIQLVKLRFPN